MGKNSHKANVLNHSDAPCISSADANLENIPSVCQAFTKVRLEKDKRRVHAVCGLCEGKHLRFVVAKEGSMDHASSPVDPGSSRRFVKMRSTLSIMGRVLISSLVSLTSPGMSQSWGLRGCSRATDPCSMKQKIHEGWLDKWNEYGRVLSSSSC